MPIAVGAAHAAKLLGRDTVVACFFGDGAVNRGPFLESLNWAAVYKLPVLFVCEDNRWAATTPTATMTAGPGIARGRKRSASAPLRATATTSPPSTISPASSCAKCAPAAGRCS